ncbi:hypothetical protein [Cephaloticoccus capnophilus]
MPEFRRTWLDYCELYNAPLAEQAARLGTSYKSHNYAARSCTADWLTRHI